FVLHHPRGIHAGGARRAPSTYGDTDAGPRGLRALRPRVRPSDGARRARRRHLQSTTRMREKYLSPKHSRSASIRGISVSDDSSKRRPLRDADIISTQAIDRRTAFKLAGAA